MADRYYSVFVGHIDPSSRKHEIRDLFEKCGPVADVFIRPNKIGGAYSYGFVRYEERAHADRAIRELHRWEVCGSAIIVQMANDTLEKLKRERAAADLLSDVRRRPAHGPAVSKSSVVEDSMFLARVKESATALTIQSTNAESNISNLMDDVQRADSRKSGTQWGSLPHPVTSFDHVTEKLIARSQEAGETGKLIGTKKAQEFISSLKTIMQEIEDFLSRTAKLCESEKTEGQSKVGQEFRQDDTWEHLMDQETNTTCYGAAKSEDCNHELEVESTEEMSDRKQRSENQGFPSRFAVEHIVDCVNQNCDSRIIDKYADINHLISETANLKTVKSVRSDIDYFKNVENTENETINDIGLDRETKDKVTFSRRVRSLDSGLSAPSLSRSPIKIVGTDTDEEVIANVPKNVSEEAAQSQAAAFYLSESLLRGQTGSVNISEQQEIHNTIAMNALKAVNNSENEYASKDIDLRKDFPNREIVQRRARSLGNDLYRGGTALPKESLCSFDNYPNQELENGVRLSEEIKANTSVTDIVRNREDSRVADSSALDKLFAKLPPLSVYGRSNSQDSSLSEDSFEGIEDSGVESDFRPSYSHIDPSEQLKSLLGIKPQGNMNVRENNGSQSRSVNAGSGSLQGGKDLKKILKPDDVRPVGRGIITRASYGRGHMYNQ